jgi:uncharacterized membrane protein SirB2
MSSYLLLKHLHVTLVILSGAGFALRGFLRLALDRPARHPLTRVAPHVIDTLLLASGVGLWLITGYPITSWLGLKLALVLVYIGLGMAAFRMKTRASALAAFGTALALYLGIVAIALFKPIG